jgi:hypothetical protein
LLVAVVALLAIGGTRVFGHQPLPAHWTSNPLWLLTTFASVWAALGIINYVVSLFTGVELTDTHLSARTLWGKQASAPWERITKIEVEDAGYGVKSLVAHADGKKLHISLDGLDRAQAHAKLSATAGPDHIVTKFFAKR